MHNGVIYKALSGFYYVDCGGSSVTCRARGKFRNDGTTPCVGDRVRVTQSGEGEGTVAEILPRKNNFIRPAVSNIDQMIIIVSAVIPITDPFLIDRIALISVLNDCEPVICINKCDLDRADELYSIYEKSGFRLLRVSAKSGEGIDELRSILKDKISVFTGNSGVGKSSILNAISPKFDIKTGDISVKLGRGRHTTRHIELYYIGDGAYAADTPGYSSFDTDILNENNADAIVNAYREFDPYLGSCRFLDCRHIKEKGCAVLAAVNNGEISSVRHENYKRLYDMAKSVKSWEIKNK